MLGMDWGGATSNGIETPVIAAFLLALQATIERLGLGIIPYADAGLSGWLNTLDQMCAPPRGRSSACTPLELELQALPWPSEAGPSLPPLSQDPVGRYRILNSPWSQFATACNASSWAANGALGRATSHPFLCACIRSRWGMLKRRVTHIRCPSLLRRVRIYGADRVRGAAQ